MKITFEKLDQGWLVEATEGTSTERLAYQTAEEAFAAVGDALGVAAGRRHIVARGTSGASAPEPELEPEREEPPPPPPSRRIGLSQPRKSAPPAGR